MKQTLTNYKTWIMVGVAYVVIAAIYSGANTCRAQSPSKLSPGLEEIVKLSKAQMGDDIIVGYIKKSGTGFHLSTDDLLYLKEQGVSQPVISALLDVKASSSPPPALNPPSVPTTPQAAPGVPPGSTPQPGPAPVLQAPGPAPIAPTPEINFNYFHDQLAPFGAWIDVGGALYWRPDLALQANPDWRPYYDMGHWTETDNGLFWQSDYTWGDIPFHYGRWVRDPALGWLWAPDYTWGPAWVFWRHAEADGAIGWAPLPVGAVYVDGAFMFHGARVGVDFDFGLGEGVFVFVGYDHFHEGFFRMRGREYAWHIHGDRFHEYYHRSVIRNEFHRDEHGRFVNNGIGRERMERATQGRVERASFQERAPVGNRTALATQSEKTTSPAGGKAAGQTGSAATGANRVYRPPQSSASSTRAASASKQPAKK